MAMEGTKKTGTGRGNIGRTDTRMIMENLRSIRFYQKCTIKHHDSSKHFKDESKRQVHYKENNHVDSDTSLGFHVGTAFKP